MLKVSVIIPTYKRPKMLRDAIRSVIEQTKSAHEIIVVWRQGDDETWSVIAQEAAKAAPELIKDYSIEEAGFLPPVRRGLSKATGDIVVFLDDDAVAHPDWLARIVKHYDNPAVGGVGGRVIEGTFPTIKVAARLTWYGLAIGNMYKEPAFIGTVPADFLMGGNMSFRRTALQNVVIDERLAANVASHWELDVTQQVKRQKYEVLYDPDVKVNHFTGPRDIIGGRKVNKEGIYWTNYNYSYLMKKHLPAWRLLAYIVFTFSIGTTGSPGLLLFLLRGWRYGRAGVMEEVLPSIRGRLRGLAS